MTFEWDVEKERDNIQKHKLSFEMATLVFLDSERIEIYDDSHSVDEKRYITIGRLWGTMVIITVVYTEREEDIRIISARKSTTRERGEYYGR